MSERFSLGNPIGVIMAKRTRRVRNVRKTKTRKNRRGSSRKERGGWGLPNPFSKTNRVQPAPMVQQQPQQNPCNEMISNMSKYNRLKNGRMTGSVIDQTKLNLARAINQNKLNCTQYSSNFTRDGTYQYCNSNTCALPP